jgi:hypothetical protein
MYTRRNKQRRRIQGKQDKNFTVINFREQACRKQSYRDQTNRGCKYPLIIRTSTGF